MPDHKKVLSCIIFVATVCGWFSQAHAIPAFSREHNTECATCHTIFPELNEYGDVFMKNGFVWNKPKKGEPAAKSNVPAVKGEGDPELLNKLKELAAVDSSRKDDEPSAAGQKRSEPLWLAGLPQTVPLSLAATLNASYNDSNTTDKVDLSARAVSLLAGGVFRDRLSFFLRYNLYAEGPLEPSISNTPTNLSPPYANDLEEFYLVWRSALNGPLNLKVGRFRPRLSLWQKTNKTTISDFATTSLRVGSSKFSVDSPEDAVELNGVFFNRLYLAGGVVDRNGQNTKEGYGHISLKFGGSDFLANEPDIDLDKESIFDYVYLVIGGYGYSGRNSGSLATTQRNNFFRGGVEMDLVVMNARLKLAWAKGIDSNPDFATHNKQYADVYAAEGGYNVGTNLIALARYEYQEMTDGTVYKRIIPSVSYAPIQNTKLTLEHQYVRVEQPVANSNNNITLLGVRVAF